MQELLWQVSGPKAFCGRKRQSRMRASLQVRHYCWQILLGHSVFRALAAVGCIASARLPQNLSAVPLVVTPYLEGYRHRQPGFTAIGQAYLLGPQARMDAWYGPFPRLMGPRRSWRPSGPSTLLLPRPPQAHPLLPPPPPLRIPPPPPSAASPLPTFPLPPLTSPCLPVSRFCPLVPAPSLASLSSPSPCPLVSLLFPGLLHSSVARWGGLILPRVPPVRLRLCLPASQPRSSFRLAPLLRHAFGIAHLIAGNPLASLLLAF